MNKMKSGVVVMTLTATVYLRKERRTYSCRIGFCGEYNKCVLSKLGAKIKRIYAEQVEELYNDVPEKPSKYCISIRTKTIECQLLNGIE